MRRSMVIGADDDEDLVDSVRTSYGMFLSRLQDDTVRLVEERIAAWTHLNVSHQEDMQVLRYGPGQEYKAHYDSVMEENSPRVATVLLYLTDVEEGGETVFPLGTGLDTGVGEHGRGGDPARRHAQQGIVVRPKKGDALLFWSFDHRLQEDSAALHAGAPVVKGVKWTGTVWIHTRPFREETLGEQLDVRRFPEDCRDYSDMCREWAAGGECTQNRGYMQGDGQSLGMCRVSCGVCRACSKGDTACLDENRVQAGFLPLYDGSDDAHF